MLHLHDAPQLDVAGDVTFHASEDMESVQVAMLTLTAIAVGVLCSVMVQLHLAIRQLRADVAATRARVEPLLDRLNQSSQIASALGVALAAAAKAFRDSQRAAASAHPTGETHV